MSITIEISSKRTHDITNLPLGALEWFTIKERVDVSQYREVTLLVRVHDKTIPSGSFVFYLVNEAPSQDDPSQYFAMPSTAPICSVGIDANTPAVCDAIPGSTTALGLASNTAPFGPYVRVLLRGTGGSATVRMNASVALVAKGT